MRKRLKDFEAKQLGIKLKTSEIGNPKYSLTTEQYNQLIIIRGLGKRKFVETIKKFDKDGNVTSTTEKLQSKPIDVPEGFEIVKISTSNTTGQQWVQFKPKIEEEIKESINYDFINEIVKKHIKPIEVELKKVDNYNNSFDRLVYTDTHIGMTPNENGFSLYGGKWDEDELFNRLQETCLFVEQNSKSDTLIIDDLGDFMDGWDGETTRKGHKLPQNMDNQKAFDVGVAFKVKMIDILVQFYENIIVNNICEDNHAGAFGYVVNSAFKSIVEHKYNNVKVTNHRKFMNHYFYGKHCFVISHGKDSKSLKFGFKPHLDPKQIEKIDQYLKQNSIYKDADFIEFSKGDSHQLLLDYCGTDDFDYCNYGAFSPSSEWVQTNFKKGRSGFVLYNIEKENNIKQNNIYFFK